MDKIKAWLKDVGLLDIFEYGNNSLDLAIVKTNSDGEAILFRHSSIKQESPFLIPETGLKTGCLFKSPENKVSYDAVDGYYVDLSPYKNLKSLPIDEKGYLDIPNLLLDIESGKHFLSPLFSSTYTSYIKCPIYTLYNSFYYHINKVVDKSHSKIIPRNYESGSGFKFRFQPIEVTDDLYIHDTHWFKTLTNNLKIYYHLKVSKDAASIASYLRALSRFDDSVIRNNYKEKELGSYNFSIEELEKAVDSYPYRDRSFFNSDKPSYLEIVTPLQEIEEMKEKVLNHCKFIPNLEIKDIRKISLVYKSDGNFDNTSDAVNHKNTRRTIKHSSKKGYEIVKTSKENPSFDYPVIYVGEAWRIYFTIGGVDYLNGNFVNFVTPEQFLETYTKLRPDLIGNDWKPWSDLIFISTDWCERNGARVKNATGAIDLQSPHQKRIALWQWIIGPLASRCLAHGNPITSLNIQVVNGPDHSKRLNKMINK